jgi:hypothetical protein
LDQADLVHRNAPRFVPDVLGSKHIHGARLPSGFNSIERDNPAGMLDQVNGIKHRRPYLGCEAGTRRQLLKAAHGMHSDSIISQD